MARKIMHLDLDAFFCAVEELRNPDLRGQAFAVGWEANERGVVLSASYAARRWGIHSAMPMKRAKKVHPKLIIVHPRHAAYRAASHKVMDQLYHLSPTVEQISIDEAFIDLSDMAESSRDIAERLQAQIWNDLGLPCSIGLASNKLVAKTATDVGKASHRSDGPPFAILEVPAGQEAAFLAPLPVKILWGVGPKTAAHLEALGIHTVGDLSRFSEKLLVSYFGKMGHELILRAKGIDDRPLETTHISKSISQERTFERDVRDPTALQHCLLDLSQGVAYRLRQEKLAGTTIRLKLRWSDFTTLTRQVTLSQPTDQDGEIYTAVKELFEQTWRNGQPIRLLGVGVSNLGLPIRQLSLWEASPEKEHRLLEAMDALRRRFGEDVVKRGFREG